MYRPIAPLLITFSLIAGCAAPVPPAAVAQPDDHAVAAALTLDPTITLTDPPLDIRRDVRQPAAFAGFEELTVTYYWLFQDDHQRDRSTDWRGSGFGFRGDRFDRQAIVQKVGVSYR